MSPPLPGTAMKFLPRALFGCALVIAPCSLASDWTWTYSVQVHATVQASPARVTLQWPVDQLPALGYTIWRKGLDGDAWGAAVSLPADASSYVDENVSVGGVYEYQIEKVTARFSAWGYIAVGINAPIIEARGKVILVIDREVADTVSSELRRLEQDLVGDGWGVVRKEVGRTDSPQSVRDVIRAEWEADRANVRAVLLFGHVPVPRAGRTNVDGHRPRPMPADVYYAEMDGTWTDADGDGIIDQGSLPSDVELEIGRVDFANLPGAYAAAPFPAEAELLRRYLDKNHAFRHARVRPPPRALMGNVTGDARGQAFAASGYRTFAALVGPENVVESGAGLHTPVSERWITKVTESPYLWTYASGAGGDYSLGTLGTHGQYNDVWGSDLIELRAKATFYMLFGSWIGEWDKTDNFMRTALAAPEYGLAAVWSGRPHYYFHPMGVGRTIGHGIRLSQNNNGLVYRTHMQRHARGVHIALMGDPTLRLNPVGPPANVRATVNGSEVAVTWSASPDFVFGYRVYRSASPGAPFERISSELHADTRLVDRPPNASEATYMVRAIALQLGPSGSYYNASQGAFSRDTFSIPDRSPSSLAPVPSRGKIFGAASEVGTDIRHPNGNIFDQAILSGNYASVAADPGQVVRVSFVDPDDDIVQVEMSGAGSVSFLFDTASGPAAPEKYNQSIGYMKGRAGIAITGADESTHVSIFSVGRANAIDQELFRDVPYDGMADIAFLTITSVDGKFGSIRTANTRYSAARGLVGIYASDIEFTGPVLIGDIDAQGSAQPVLHLGAAGTDNDRANEVRIAGGDLAQSNGRPIAISGIRRLYFDAGMTSHGVPLPRQANRGRLELNNVDVTSQVVVTPAP
jgi:hypothetical protein